MLLALLSQSLGACADRRAAPSAAERILEAAGRAFGPAADSVRTLLAEAEVTAPGLPDSAFAPACGRPAADR